MSDNKSDQLLRAARPEGWHRKRWPYSGTLERRQAAVRLACFTADAADGLPLGTREAARRSGIPASTINDWVHWELRRLGLLAEWQALSPILARRSRKL